MSLSSSGFAPRITTFSKLPRGSNNYLHWNRFKATINSRDDEAASSGSNLPAPLEYEKNAGPIRLTSGQDDS